MVDNNAAKSHLNNVETTLNNLDNVSNINTVIAARSLDLFRNLTSNNFFVDKSAKDAVESIMNRLNTTLISDANTKFTELENERAALPAWPASATRRAEIGSECSKLRRIVTAWWLATTNVSDRFNEYLNLYNCSNLFDLDTNLWDLDINTAWGGARTISLSPFWTGSILPSYNRISPKYSLCDETWNVIRPHWWSYKINIWWVEYTIWGIRFTWWILDCTAITITPALQSSPQEIVLSINASYDNVLRDVNVVCNKKFKLKLNDWTFPLDAWQRNIQFENYNTALPIWHKILDTIETEFTTNRYKVERNVLEKILKKNWWTKYDTLNPKQKEDFYQMIRKQIVWWISYFDNIYNIENLNIPTDRYNWFKTRFTADWKEWNKWDNIKESANYITYIHNTVTEKIDDFLSDKLSHFMWTLSEETRLKSELTKFLDKIEKNKLDDDLNNRINTDISSEGHRMDKWPRSLIHNRDTNYMRFFSGSSTNLKWETVDIHTNTSPDSIDNPEPVKYDLDLKVTGKNNISVDIKIEWTNEVISHKSWEPSALVRKIMRDQRIKYGKVRAHIWYNIYKSMINLAKEKNISLQYRDSSDHTRFIDIENWNIIVRQVDNLTTLNKEDWEIIFDQDKFVNMNIFDESGNNWALRQWLDVMGIHFNLAMNALHKQYRQWTERRLLWLIRSKNTFNLPTSFWHSPIKKILNMRNNLNFDFSTNINSGWKGINVEFKKNKFTINMDWLKKSVSSIDLWKILNHRENKIRVFDGKERDILEWIYVSLISKLRENSKVNRTDFGVVDNITWNMYVLDQDWEFWMITKEDLETYWNPIKWSFGKESWSLSQANLSWLTVRKLNNEQTKELLRNPFLMQRLIKTMNHRMGLYSSIVSAFIK